MPIHEKFARLNQVSPCFCLAKWLQVTIDLVHGTTHSCHHPARHPVPLSELAGNPGALHNTRFKKEQRRLMLEGVRPPECAYCWDIEDTQPGAVSDRIIKSTDPWAWGELDRIRSLPWDADVNPTYLELMLDDLCSASCIYCMADISSSIAQEMKRHGPYDVRNREHRMPQHPQPEGENPWLAAFWKWFPEVLPKLKVLRITGGEPLLSPQFAKLMEFLEQGTQPELTLVLNSHLGHPEARLKGVADRIARLREQGSIRNVELYTSLDAHGVRAEYIRSGLNYEQVLRNVGNWSRWLPSSPVVIMCTYNILSVSSFQDFLEEILGIKRDHPNVILDISYLRNPEYLRADMADARMKSAVARSFDFMKASRSVPGAGFSDHEILKMANVLAWVSKDTDAVVREANRRDFFVFVQQFDKRKGTSFLGIFPEYKDFFIACKQSFFSGLNPVRS